MNGFRPCTRSCTWAWRTELDAPRVGHLKQSVPVFECVCSEMIYVPYFNVRMSLTLQECAGRYSRCLVRVPPHVLINEVRQNLINRTLEAYFHCRFYCVITWIEEKSRVTARRNCALCKRNDGFTRILSEGSRYLTRYAVYAPRRCKKFTKRKQDFDFKTHPSWLIFDIFRRLLGNIICRHTHTTQSHMEFV